MTSIAILNREHIIAQVAAGALVGQLARALGFTSHAAISERLAGDKEYQAAREQGLEARLEMREIELEKAETGVTVARAKELLSHQRWRCEREFPARWGAKNQLHVTGTLTLDDALAAVEARMQVIDAEEDSTEAGQGDAP